MDDLLPASAPSCTSRWRARSSAAPRGCRSTAAPTSPPASPTTTWSPATSRPRSWRSVRAAEAAEGVHANGEAAALYSRALKLWDRVADAEELDRPRPRRAAARRRVDDRPRARACARRDAPARRAAGARRPRPERAAGLLELVAREQFSQGRSAEAAETRRSALELLPGRAERDARDAAGAPGQGADARVALPRGRGGRARRRSRSLAPPATRSPSCARWTRMGVALFGLARYDEGEAVLREALRAAARRAACCTSRTRT